MTRAPGVRRICYFVGTHGDWGGASRIIFNIVRNLDRTRFEPMLMLTGRGPIAEELERLGIGYRIWKHEPRYRMLGHFGQVWRAMSFYRRHRVDIVAMSYDCLGWRPAEILAARLAGIPVIQHCQQVTEEASPYTRLSTLILTCSEYVRSRSSFGRVPTECLYDIVAIDRFGHGEDIRRDLGLSPSNLSITFLGRKRRSKGLDVFVSLTSVIRDPQIRFLLAVQRTGRPNVDTYDDSELDALIATDPRVRHVGFRSDIQDVYAASDIIVMPSQSEEPCPAVALEAAASGKPIVATDTGATRELVADGVSGFLVPRHDSVLLAQRVQQLADDAELRAAMGKAAQAIAHERFYAQPLQQLHRIYSTIGVRSSRRRTSPGRERATSEYR